MDLATAGPSDLEPFVGTSWATVLPDGKAADLVLSAVERGPGNADARPFRLLFHGGPTPPLPQGVMTLVNQSAGHVDLFLVPATPDAEGPIYVAVFG